MKINTNYLRLTKISLCICLGSTIANAQTTEHHYTAASDSNDAWTNNANWDTNRPDGPEIRAIFGELDKPEVDRVNINFGSNLLLTPNVLEVGSLRFLDSFNTEASPFLIRNSNTASYGTLKLYGIETSIDGKCENILIENYADQNIRFSPTNAGYEIELNNSGIIHQDGAGILYLRTEITEAGGSHSITKTGSGILQLDRRDADFGSDQS